MTLYSKVKEDNDLIESYEKKINALIAIIVTLLILMGWYVSWVRRHKAISNAVHSVEMHESQSRLEVAS